MVCRLRQGGSDGAGGIEGGQAFGDAARSWLRQQRGRLSAAMECPGVNPGNHIDGGQRYRVQLRDQIASIDEVLTIVEG
jgi:hypothetical protein